MTWSPEPSPFAAARSREPPQAAEPLPVSGPWACDECLRRTWLIAGLSARIEGVVGSNRAGTRELLALEDEELARALGGRKAEDVLQRARLLDPTRLRSMVRRVGCWACCRHDRAYPRPLLQLGDAPAVLFGRGARSLLMALGEGAAVVTVVGSRRASAYGRELAERLGRELAAAGAIVVSGMAYGIDSCAHLGALAAQGSTVAVLGGGPERASPAGMARLYDRIAGSGLVLSELPPGTEPRRWTFPARNRIMAALSGMTVVVEARERSGSLITAAMATDLGREVGAVPGQVGGPAASGTNSLLRDGAQVVRDARDVLDSLLGVQDDRSQPAGGLRDRLAALPNGLAAALEQVERGADCSDAVALGCGIPVDDAAVALVELELEGLVRSDSAGRYRPATG